MAGWTRPTGHPAGQVAADEEILESPPPSRPLSSDEIDQTAAAAADAEAAWDLKGEELDKALEDADLPRTGSADEKRERLAKHLAESQG